MCERSYYSRLFNISDLQQFLIVKWNIKGDRDLLKSLALNSDIVGHSFKKYIWKRHHIRPSIYQCFLDILLLIFFLFLQLVFTASKLVLVERRPRQATNNHHSYYLLHVSQNYKKNLSEAFRLFFEFVIIDFLSNWISGNTQTFLILYTTTGVVKCFIQFQKLSGNQTAECTVFEVFIKSLFSFSIVLNRKY